MSRAPLQFWAPAQRPGGEPPTATSIRNPLTCTRCRKALRTDGPLGKILITRTKIEGKATNVLLQRRDGLPRHILAHAERLDPRLLHGFQLSWLSEVRVGTLPWAELTRPDYGPAALGVLSGT